MATENCAEGISRTPRTPCSPGADRLHTARPGRSASALARLWWLDDRASGSWGGARTAGDGAEQRERILRAVAPLIAKHGAPKVRLRDVAAEAGVSVGMIQHYFATRDRLIDEAFRHYSLAVVEELEAVSRPGDDPWRRLVALCKAATSSGKVRQRSIIWFDFVGQASRDTARQRLVQQVYEAWVEAFAAVVQDGTAAGVFRPVVEPRMVAAQLVALVDGLDVAVAIRVRHANRAWREEHLLSAARALLGVA